MELKIEKTANLTFIFLLLSCASQAGEIIDRARFQGEELRLKASEDACILEYRASSIALTPKPPCYFLRGADGGIQHYSYPDVGVDAVIVVTGTPVSVDMLKDWSLNAADKCGSEAQGVLFKESRLVVTDETLQRGVLCRDSGADEKVFWQFAHPGE